MAKTAVVLAGGGSRGAYQIGVWKALREMGIEYQLVTGTSVGALNGALMVQGDYEKALSVWENLSFQDVVGDMIEDKTDLSDRRLTRLFAREALEKGGANISALERFVYSLIDEEVSQLAGRFCFGDGGVPFLKTAGAEKAGYSPGNAGGIFAGIGGVFSGVSGKGNSGAEVY